ncbi:energy-coupling factor ABC transporter ATP-binding protein [Halodesulfovibrio marinisediminis]|uniref:Tungstate transport system ATP-binding protein n=1 Tax=Halodesulfovibrio marinisediminis DSM 17456 TaxID=1121457 RepID=A0A1N6FXF9_9BACT|nr:ATP-binding cassette domain-containing protein [Halodesulfovibrio marinisediminis]SIN99964.1 tungstate transport system ATP-binding protein [Halodesulfovibrio marinisediminis DSM 17456]
MSLYQLSNIVQTYGGRTVLTIDSLTLESGTITGIIGPNGSGKSTLMRMLAFLEAPKSGTLLFRDAEASITDTSLRREVTLLTQQPYLLKRTVKENVEYGLRVRGMSNITDMAATALEEVGLSPETFLNRNWFELSGGEAQRVALAARLAINPSVLLMDEPTSSLDEESTERIRNAAIRAKAERNTSLVIVSHDREWLTSVSDRTILIRNGKIESAHIS